MKHVTDRTNDIQQLKGVLVNGPWGTVGPKFFAASDAVAAYCQAKYGLVTFSASAALETILRGWNIAYEDEVIVASWSDPMDAMVTAAVGATPVFADVCSKTLTLTCEGIAPYVNTHTRAVIADLPAGNPCDAKALSEFCQEKGVRLILNMGDAWATTLNGRPISQYADAAFFNMAEGGALDVGLAGAVITDDQESFDLFYAYHNCGRPLGEGSTLSFDEIIGGDLRVAEWQASLIPGQLSVLKDSVADCRSQRETLEAMRGDDFETVAIVEGGVSSCCGTLLRFVPGKSGKTLEEAVNTLREKGIQAVPYYPVMHAQPFWGNAYFEKLTGKTLKHEDTAYPGSLQASAAVLYAARK